MWPEFRRADFESALLDYQQRERRFGLTGEQVRPARRALRDHP
jgi:undecaprenyl diphosphate synthase